MTKQTIDIENNTYREITEKVCTRDMTKNNRKVNRNTNTNKKDSIEKRKKL